MSHIPYITVLAKGLPAPQGSKRHVGRGRLIEASKKVAPWRAAVARAARDAAREQGWDTPPRDVPLELVVDFYLPRPQAARYRVYPHVRPDLDKLVRAVCDSLQTAQVYADDAQVVSIRAHKRYPTPPSPAVPHPTFADPGAFIVVRRLLT